MKKLFFLIMLLAPGLALANISVVQSFMTPVFPGYPNYVNSYPVALPHAVTIGNSVFGSSPFEPSIGQGTCAGPLDRVMVGSQLATIDDVKGSGPGGSPDGGFGPSILTYHLLNVQNAATTVTLSSSGGCNVGIGSTAFVEIAGLPSTASIDAHTAQFMSLPAGAQLTSGTVTPSAPGDFLYGIGMVYDFGSTVLNPGSGWSLINNCATEPGAPCPSMFATAQEYQAAYNSVSPVAATFALPAGYAANNETWAGIIAVKSSPGATGTACQSGSTCETFAAFSGIIKLVATGTPATDTANFKAALASCGPNASISFTGQMQINAPLGDPPAGCEITGYDNDPYEGGSGTSGGSMLAGVQGAAWTAGTALIGSNDGVTFQHFTIDGHFGNTGNCVNVHNVQGFTAMYVHVFKCVIGWNIVSDGNDASHSQRFNKDIQIWNSINMRNGITGTQTTALNGGSNTDIQNINPTYSQNGLTPSEPFPCTLSQPGNVLLQSGTTGYIHLGSRNEDSFCPGNHAWDIENSQRITIFGTQSDMLASYNLVINNSSSIALVGTEWTNGTYNGSTLTNFGPFIQLAGTIDRLVSFGSNINVDPSSGCVYSASGTTLTNSAIYDQPYGRAAFCDTGSATAMTPFYVSNDRAFP